MSLVIMAQLELCKSILFVHSPSEIPQELVHAAKGGEVDIDIQDRRIESYVKPKPKLVAFSGEGHKLGG